MATFPHLEGANGFPGVSNVRAFAQYPNSFDYSRWQADTRILLCSVPWDGLANVVEWASDDARDSWFEGLPGYRDTLQTEMRILPDGMVKVPLPFDASGLYNYCWVTFPIATSADEPLDYEDPKQGVRHWGFFVDDLKYRSPSCTELKLSVDWWTTFAGSVKVNSLQLARGHYAMAHAADVDTFLAEPIAHTAWLGGDEPDKPQSTIVNVKASVVLDDSTACMVFDVGAAAPAGDFSSGVPQLAHWTARSGFPAGCLFAVALTDLDTFATGAPTGLWQCVRACYVVPTKWLSFSGSGECGGVTIRYVSGGASLTRDVHLTQADFGYPADYAGITKLYTGSYASVHVTSDSGQDVRIAPEELGATQRLDLASQATAAGVRIVSVLQGVGSSALQGLTLSNLAASSFVSSGAWQRTMMTWDLPTFAIYQSSDELRTYTQQFARAQARANAATAQTNANASAKSALDNADASATTAQANANASATTAQTNANASAKAALDNADASATTAQDNANASATTAQTNANASASTAQTNANASASTAQTNANASAATVQTNANASASTAQTNAGNSADNVTANNAVSVAANNSLLSYKQQAALTGVGYSNAKLNADYDVDQRVSSHAYDAELAGLAVASQNNDASAFASGVSAVVDAVTDIGGEGFGLGILTSATNAYTGWATANASIAVSQSNSETLYTVTTQQASAKTLHATEYNTNATTLQNSNAADNTSVTNSASTSVANNNSSLMTTNAANTYATATANSERAYDTATGNASNTYATATANSERAYDTATGNASNTYATATANSKRSYDTSVANAQRTYDAATSNAANTYVTATANSKRSYDTSVANAQRTYDASVANAQRSYDNSIAAVDNGIKTDAAGAPVSFGATANVDSRAIVPMCVQVKVERASDDDVARCGDKMLRYGYVCDRNVRDFDGWQVMRHYSYWQCEEAWISADGSAPEAAVAYMRGLLATGVTIWSDPDEIGAVSIYDN